MLLKLTGHVASVSGQNLLQPLRLSAPIPPSGFRVHCIFLFSLACPQHPSWQSKCRSCKENLKSPREVLFFFFNICLFNLAVLGLCCCEQAFCSCGKQGLLFTYVSQASHHGGFSCCRAQAVALMGFSSCGSQAPEPGLSNCGTRAQLPCSMWDIPRLEIELVSATLQGRFLTTGPPGKPPREVLDLSTSCLNMYCLLKTIHPIMHHDRGDLTHPHPALMSVSPWRQVVGGT